MTGTLLEAKAMSHMEEVQKPTDTKFGDFGLALGDLDVD